MLTKFMTRFKPEEAAQREETQKQQMKKKKKLNNQKRNKSSGTTKASSQEAEDGGRRSSQTCNMDVIGLRIVTQITNSHTKPDNVVVKSAILRKEKYNTNDNTTTAATAGSTSLGSCFLKTCNLCNKKLSHDKDIYMYRGDQGFCSIECRNWQIEMDEMKEAEAFRNHYYKQSVSLSSSSYRNCWNDARRETHLILEDLRLQRLQSKPIPDSAHHHQNHWAIVS